MNGLQSSLVSRSKLIYGEFEMDVKDLDPKTQNQILEDLTDYEIEAYPEIEAEILIRHQTHISPLIIHGINFQNAPSFLKGFPEDGMIMGADLSRSIQAFYGGEIQMVTPSEMDNFLGDIPRTTTSKLSEIIQTDVAEIDLMHGWIRDSAIFNLLKTLSYNKIRFAHLESMPKAIEITKNSCQNFCQIKTWEETHQALSWALNLESRMMLFLFTAMSFLVAISITAGLLIFFDKIKTDLASYWIMGMDKGKLYKMTSIFTYALSGVACGLGVLLGCFVLKILELYSHDLMPEVFVERSLPVEFSFMSIVVSFMIPMVISFIFSMISVNYILKQESSFLNIVRGHSS